MIMYVCFVARKYLPKGKKLLSLLAVFFRISTQPYSNEPNSNHYAHSCRSGRPQRPCCIVIHHHATPVSSWTKSAGSTAITGLDTANPVFGNGTANSANGYQIYATLPETYTLSAVGDTLTFSGSVALTIAGDSGADQFRFGLFNTHSSSTTNGWLGYFATNSGTGANPNGRLWERTATNTTAYFNNGAGMADERQAFAGTPQGNLDRVTTPFPSPLSESKRVSA